jgi:hypothetical protein
LVTLVERLSPRGRVARCRAGSHPFVESAEPDRRVVACIHRLQPRHEVCRDHDHVQCERAHPLVAYPGLERSRDPDHRRARLITFTGRGRAALDVALAALRRSEERLERRIGPRRMRELRRTLAEVSTTTSTC